MHGGKYTNTVPKNIRQNHSFKIEKPGRIKSDVKPHTMGISKNRINQNHKPRRK